MPVPARPCLAAVSSLDIKEGTASHWPHICEGLRKKNKANSTELFVTLPVEPPPYPYRIDYRRAYGSSFRTIQEMPLDSVVWSRSLGLAALPEYKDPNFRFKLRLIPRDQDLSQLISRSCFPNSPNPGH